MNRTRLWLAIALLGLPFCAHAVDPPSCDTVRFADVGWTDITVTTAVTRLVLGELGYGTQVKRLSVPDTYKALQGKQIDVFLGNWMPSMENDIKPYTENGSVQTLGANLEGAKYTLAANQSAREGGLNNFTDIARFKTELSGKIYGIEPGNDGNKLIARMIDENAFGLADFTLVESSEAGMLSQVRRADTLKQWAVFLAWEPHPMNNSVHPHYLDGGDEYFGPDYGGATVYTNVRAGYAEECANVGRFLKNLRFSLQMENDLMTAILNQSTNRRREAKAWLLANPQTVASWLEGVTRRDGSAAGQLFDSAKSP
ncbi:choline ABC transporter substrate-binding protein [Phytopseudomonas dryadis]|uniref:Glycine/betaine ABC transporter substrate-binding protein n=1 Tax=Phytopseudomonas dryadis TaxID=2487520 RepID=A0A4Q9QWG2_9GAMM|nr:MULTISPECIES: choline ABC transporter substrate-binding protein [Pseudomonas]TBU87632.1 glycine/betaine ABC transporter substrate-binding protein [Pseudomonas dryadis]TBV06477.1 glycine/betaine ABC transporter substrate-binding protein [Pseudomonas dryadis]TBV17944.1 glycine/betaine ABC transporter substrate-binding protein [Pseudomonas sp. FRB 230]